MKYKRVSFGLKQYNDNEILYNNKKINMRIN